MLRPKAYLPQRVRLRARISKSLRLSVVPVVLSRPARRVRAYGVHVMITVVPVVLLRLLIQSSHIGAFPFGTRHPNVVFERAEGAAAT